MEVARFLKEAEGSFFLLGPRGNLSALKSFAEDYPESKKFLLYRGR